MSMTTAADLARPDGRAWSLVSLLGEQRAAIVEHLRRNGDASVAELATRLQISEVAVRRHLGILAEDDLVSSRTVAGSRGRPAARYRLTEAATQLFPQNYDRFANEVLDFLDAQHGREGLRAFLRWRLQREVDGLKDAVTAEDLQTRLQQLAGALSASGFDASVSEDGECFALVQEHCAIYDVAKDHPEVCAYEAATFSQVLGGDVQLSRRETLAGGASACVCTVRPCGPGDQDNTHLHDQDAEAPTGRGDEYTDGSGSRPSRPDVHAVDVPAGRGDEL